MKYVLHVSIIIMGLLLQLFVISLELWLFSVDDKSFTIISAHFINKTTWCTVTRQLRHPCYTCITIIQHCIDEQKDISYTKQDR